MGTKNNPGAFDCYAAAEPDEPMFVLLGRDPTAALAVTFWVKMRLLLDPSDAKAEEARDCARALEMWVREKKGDQKVEMAFAAFRLAIVEVAEKIDERNKR